MPFGLDNYADYCAMLEGYANKHKEVEPELSESILMLEEAVKKMNVEEEWSIVCYFGEDFGSR